MRKDADPVFFVPCGLEKLETCWKQSPEESYPVCILPFDRFCKGNKTFEVYRRYYKSSRLPESNYFLPVHFSCIPYHQKGLDRNTTMVEIASFLMNK